MKILFVHNHYQQRGGEDRIFEMESALLKQYGHHVINFSIHNNQIDNIPVHQLVKNTIWNDSIYSTLQGIIRRERPDIAHFHNTFPLISPAAYYAAKREGIPVIQRLPNYRLLCINAYLLRDTRVCEDCVGKLIPWPGVQHNCYRASKFASLTVAAMLSFHRFKNTWNGMVDKYIALTEFGKNIFIKGGLPADKITVKPNFVTPDPGYHADREKYALFVGRLSPEKGIDILLAAWKKIKTDFNLIIVGDGPLNSAISSKISHMPNVKWVGRKSKEDVLALMKGASFVLFPSLWYEGFPVVIVEAYSTGTAVISSDLGSMSELISHGQTGLLCSPGDISEWVSTIDYALSHPEEIKNLGDQARIEFENKYTDEKNYQKLIEIYKSIRV